MMARRDDRQLELFGPVDLGRAPHSPRGGLAEVAAILRSTGSATPGGRSVDWWLLSVAGLMALDSSPKGQRIRLRPR